MVEIGIASTGDAESILALQKLAYRSEAELYNDWSIPPLTQTMESILGEFTSMIILKATLNNRLVGSVRARLNNDTCAIGRLVVHPEHQGQGIGTNLLRSIEEQCHDVSKYELFTGTKSEANIRLYQRHGYTIARTQQLTPTISVVILEKQNEPLTRRCS